MARAAATAGPPASIAPRRRVARAAVPTAFAGILALAAALRLVALDRVPPDPFYDAAVRTMAGSWHALLVGALEPGARVSIDKPPLDLWLQVASVKALGFGRVALQLPAALSSIAAVALLYDLVRRLAGPVAGLAAAAVLAVLPAAVITARSDTMDSVMAALLVLAAWLLVRACQTGRPWLLYASAAAAGLAFEAKQLESLVAAPALIVLAGGGWTGRRRHLGGAAATFAVVALAWLAAISLLPAGERPFALGSAHGSAWDAAFLYDGVGRLGGAPRAHTDPPGVTRLLLTHPIDAGVAAGAAAAAAALFGLLAVLSARGALSAAGRLRRAAVLSAAAWLGTGLVVYSAMASMHIRYYEGFTAAVAAALGAGAAALARAATHRAAAAAAHAGAIVAVAAYALWLAGTSVALATAVTVAAAAALALAAAMRRRPALWPAAVAATLAVVLAVPLVHSLAAVRGGTNDAEQWGAIAPPVQRRLSAFLISHQGRARDEAAVESPYVAAGIVVHDRRPVLVVDNTGTRPIVRLGALRRAIRRGQVRYVLLGPACRRRRRAATAGCVAPRWVAAHGVNVSVRAGIAHSMLRSRLYRVGARVRMRAAAPGAGSAGTARPARRPRSLRSDRGPVAWHPATRARPPG